jgi:two-component system LytT family response regulator
MTAPPLRLVIVDDERLARRRLEALLARSPGVELLASCASAEDALRVLDDAPADCVLLDIEMPGASGLELARRLAERDLPVVFVTAHAQHGAAAFDLEALDYLVKPFDDDRFARALERVRGALGGRAGTARWSDTQRVPVERDGRIRLVELSGVECIEADGKGVRLHTEGETLPLRMTLRQLEHRLDPSRFVRVHRRFIVRVAAIVELGRAFHGDWLLSLKSGRQVLMSRRYRRRLDLTRPLEP